MPQKLSEKYASEREEICKKIINVLKLDDKQSFLLHDLDTDTEKQELILNMKPEIQKYFACSSMSAFRANFESKRPCLNIIKGVLRQQKYLFTGSSVVIKLEDGKTKSTKRYHVIKSVDCHVI